MGNIFKIYHQKLVTDSSYTLLYVKLFYRKCDFAQKKDS